MVVEFRAAFEMGGSTASIVMFPAVRNGAETGFPEGWALDSSNRREFARFPCR